MLNEKNYTLFACCWFLPAIIALLHLPLNIQHCRLVPLRRLSASRVWMEKYTLASFKNAAVLVLVFTCNHCPTAQAYEDRLIQLKKEYGTKGVAVVVIMQNDPNSITLNELNY